MANIQYFGVEEGLSHREVYTIHQDQEGFLWIGTKYGLNRFDGYEFKWFTKANYDLASNTIHHIVEDGGENLWLFESFNWFYFDIVKSVSILDPQSNTVQPYYKKFSGEAPVKVEEMDYVVSSPEGWVYFGVNVGGLYAYHPEKGWKELIEKGGLSFKPMLATSKGTLWGMENDHTAVIELDTLGKVQRRIEFPDYLGSDAILNISHLEDEHYLWILVLEPTSAKKKLLKIDLRNPRKSPEVHEEESSSIQDPFARYYYQPQHDFLWYKGVPQLKIQKGEKQIFDFSKDYPELVAADIHDIYFDRSNNVWIGSFYGLYQVDLHEDLFQKYLFNSNNDKPSNDFYSCRGIWAGKDKVLINTYKGVHVLSKNGENHLQIAETKVFDPNGSPQRMLVLPHAIMQDHEGRFWFGDIGLVCVDSIGSNSEVFPYEKFHEDDIGGMIWSIFQDEGEKIWVGTQRGLGFLDKQAKVCRAFNVSYPYEDLNNSTIYAIAKGASNHLYLCTNSGLYVFDPKVGIIGRYWSEGKGSWYIPSNDIRHILLEAEGKAWLATYGSGLLNITLPNPELLNEGETFRQFSIEHGLANNNLYAVYQDKMGNLWLSSDYGLIAFNIKTFQSQTFLPKDGATHHEFNTISHFQASDGRLYFGSLNGVTAFYPEDVLKKEGVFDAPLVVTSFQQYDKESRTVEDKLSMLNQTGNIVLQPGEGFFDLSFASLTYQNVEKTRYLYRIDGLHKDWTYTKKPSIRFSGLPYGSYNLRIMAQGHDGQISAHGLNLPVFVQKPFYFQAWFLATIVIFLLLGAVGIHKLRMYHAKQRQRELKLAVQDATKIIVSQNQQLVEDKATIENQADELQRLDTLKSIFFANISHELRTPLTLLLGPIKSLTKSNWKNLREKRLLQLAEKNVLELLNLVNEILDLSKLDSQKLELSLTTVNLYKLIRQIATSFRSLAEEKNIAFFLEYKADGDLHLELDERKFKKILNNLLSNAIKFTESDGKVELAVADKGNSVWISVKDTGRGIHPEDIPHIFDRFYQAKQVNADLEGGTGIGLALSQELVELMKGKIWVESHLEYGSTFFFQFPKKEIINGCQSNAIPEGEKVISPGRNSLMDSAVELVIANTPRNSFNSNDSKRIKNHVLLVEDNRDLVEYISIILEGSCHTDVSSNGKEAMKFLEKNSILPDIILCDVMMPIMDGFGFLEIVKANDQLRHIPIIMLTAKTTREDKLRALRLGVDDYIIKPFDEDELILRMDNLLKNAEERKKSIISISKDRNDNEDDKDGRQLHLMQADIKWLEEQEDFLKNELSNTDFTISHWANEQNMSERNLQRRLKQLTGLSPHHYMTEVRLQRARKLIERGEFRSLSEVAYTVGFTNLQTFSRNFKKRFGKAPSRFVK